MQTLSISELAATTGVPPASIHHYLKQGLLPAPERLSRNRFAYDERHVLGLRLIRALRQRRRLPLDLVRRIMPELLDLQGEEAFRPEIWDRALAPARRQHPGQRILVAAKDAFARRGYGDVNVDDICEQAGIAKGSFYRHYRSKEELFFAAARSLAEDVLEASGEAVRASAPVQPDRAATVLARAIGPHAPLFLELLARSLQGRPADAAVAAEIFRRASREVGRWTAGRGSAESRGSRVIGAALGNVLGTGLRPAAALADAGAGPDRPAPAEGRR